MRRAPPSASASFRRHLPSTLVAGLLLAWTVVAAGPKPESWPGVVVDDESAEFTGEWVRVAKPSSLVGPSYRHDDEAALAHTGGGRIVYLSRHESPFYRLSYSANNGGQWEQKESLLYLGGGDNPPKLTLLPDGKTLAAIVHSWYPGTKTKDRRQLASVISRDGGRTWDNFRLIGFAPEGDDGFLQHSIAIAGETAYLFYGGGSRLDTNDGKDLRLIRLSQDFFTSTSPWPYDWQGRTN